MVNYTEDGEEVQTHAPIFFNNASTNSKFLQNTQVKSFVFELHSTWCDAQRKTAENGGQLTIEHALELSRAYRTSISAVKSLIGSSNNAVANEIYNAELLWSLTEEIYMKPADIPIVLNIISWANNCFSESTKLVDERLADTSETPEDHEFYWNSIILSIFRVNLSAAVRLLRKHSRFEKDGAIQQICFFLESFQTFLEQSLPNPTAFLDVQRKVRDVLQSGSFRKSEQLTIVAGLLMGKNESYEKCARMLFDNWYELLPAYALFTCPGATIENIGRIAQTLYNTLCPTGVHVSVIESLVSDIDRPIFSILCRNPIDMLKQVCEKSNLWWFPVHFIDLIYRFDSTLIVSLSESFPTLKRKQNPSSTQQDENNQPLTVDKFLSVRSAIVIDYGRVLMESRNFWIVASDYLNSISMEELDSEPNFYTNLTSVKKAEFIYTQAVKNGQKATQDRICHWFVDRYVDQECLSEALCWALRSELPELINSVSNKLLLVSSAESISTMKIFDGMAEQFYKYPSLLLLQRFYEFRRSLSNGQAAEAVSRIHELITSGIAPIDFQLILFDQMTRLLDSSEFIQTPQLDRDSLYDLMKAINKFQIQDSIINPQQKENPTTLELNTKIKFFRQALCTALASRSLS